MAGAIADLLVKMDVDSAKFRKEIGDINGSLSVVAKQLETLNDRVKDAFSVAAIYAAGKAMKDFIVDTVNAADQMNDTAERIGTTTESFSRLAYAAKMSGVEQEELTSSLTKFIKNSQEAASGAKSQAAAFAAIGISAERLRSASTEELLDDMAEAFSRMQDGAGKSALAMEFFGKSGATMVPLLNQGRAGIKALAEEADALGITLDAKTVQAAAHFNDNLDKLNLSSKTFGKTLFNELAPGLNVITDQMVEANKTYGETSGIVSAVATALKAVTTIGVGVAHVFSEVWNELGMIGAQAVVVGKSLSDYFKGNEMAGHAGAFREVEREYAERIKRIRDQRTEFLNALWNPEAEIPIEFVGPKKIAAPRLPSPSTGGKTREDSIVDALDDYDSKLREAESFMNSLASAQEKLSNKIEKANELYEDGALSLDDLNKAMVAIEGERVKEMVKAHDEIARSAEQSIDKMNAIAMKQTSRESKATLAQWSELKKEHEKTMRHITVTTEEVATAFSRTLANQIRSGFKEGLKGMAEAFAATMADIAARIAANRIVFGILNAFASAGAGAAVSSGTGGLGINGVPSPPVSSGVSALTAGSGPSVVQVKFDDRALDMTLRDWFERELANASVSR